jgi:hypothetical protein
MNEPPLLSKQMVAQRAMQSPSIPSILGSFNTDIDVYPNVDYITTTNSSYIPYSSAIGQP